VTTPENQGIVQRINVDGKMLSVRILREPTVDQPSLVASIDGRVLITKREENADGNLYLVRLNGRLLKLSLESNRPTSQKEGTAGTILGPMMITAPMSGRIVALKASPDLRVSEGEPIAVLEAMKMENEIASPKTGTVTEVYIKPGALVKAGDRLCLIS
jgi:biotin carboxyl carrier protein